VAESATTEIHCMENAESCYLDANSSVEDVYL
jgi:hypothetical protein